MTADIDTEVIIVGAGPAGLTAAIELGRRNVKTLVVERGAHGAYKSPRVMLINDRSMEHLRRWGIADALRASNPIDPELVPDVLFATRLNGYPLHRFVRPFVGQGRHPYVSERAEWTPQHRIESALRDHAESFDCVRFLWQHDVVDVAQTDAMVSAHLVDAEGRRSIAHALYLAGCDGSHSVVRKAAQVRLEGHPNLLRAFKYHVRAPLKDHAKAGLASFYWFVNSSFDSGASVLLNALDDNDGWGFACYPVPAGVDGDDPAQVAEVLFAAVGERVPVQFISGKAWNMHGLVAPTFSRGRILLAGDAAHLMPNLGGFGMNTSILDAIDLAWKVAAVIAGWGGPRLIDSYDAERRPTVQWVLRQQMANAAVLSADLYRAGAEEAGPHGDRVRQQVAAEIRRTKTAEFDSLGLQKGYRYDDSPIVVSDGSSPDPGDPVAYRQTGRPGSVAPHRWLGDGRSLYDVFGPEWTLLRLDRRVPVEELCRAASQARMPLSIVDIDEPGLKEEWGAAAALVRPDQHVAWRGDAVPREPTHLLDVARGA